MFEGSQTTKLVEIDKVWVLIYNNEEYVRLLDAKSREDAERQVAEMLFLGSANRQVVSGPEENAPMVKLAPPASTSTETRVRRR